MEANRKLWAWLFGLALAMHGAAALAAGNIISEDFTG